MPSFSFEDAIRKIQGTPKGKEASMYGPIRDLFIQVFGYPAEDVDIDTTGEGGRPDVTARAPSGLTNEKGKAVKIDWIVVEAKDQRGVFGNPSSREIIFDQKSKYIGTNTAWFVMVDPDIIVLRQVTGQDFAAVNDIEIPLVGLTRPAFEEKISLLSHSKAGVPAQLKRFRGGDTKLIATEKLDRPDPATATKKQLNRYSVTRRRFFNNIREGTAHLQSATRNALNKVWPEIDSFRKLADDFGKLYCEKGTSWSFNPHTLTISGKPDGTEQTRQHKKDALELRKKFKSSPNIVRLALDGLPSFQARTGADEKNLAELFSIETANLILARILLLRFFEDNGFFGPTKYVCNGGVEAFQKMREYFKAGYTRLLEEAYRQASHLYAAAFDETELDWVLGVNDSSLSNAIEWSMFQLSRYDFTTVKGDILTGIYDRFMDREQRKKLGEFYTPPSIARYIVKRVGIDRNSRVLDPACGSGTFLIEAYRAMVGNDIERGAAEYSDALETLSCIAGNDLNTFSSVLTQIQLLWQVLGMRKEIEKHGFPDIPVTGRVNSLVKLDQWSSLDRFGEIDQPIYDAVIGNPPYVRSERSGQELDQHTIEEFERGNGVHKGISAKQNAYALFIYRALESWCKPPTAEGNAGRLGFIVPVSLFDANGTEDLRNLFGIGGRWTIREIIDLEIIYKQVFDADVLPAIVIAENRPATPEDVVLIRLASNDCVKLDQLGALASFDFERLPEQRISYQDLFTPDGRIMTRLTPARLAIIRKLWMCDTLKDATKRYWIGRSKGASGKIVDKEPDRLVDYSERFMISGGIAFRKQKAYIDGGIDVYKGENIVAGELQGGPVETGVDLDKISDNSLWSIRDILPPRGFAVPVVAHCPNAVAFDPARMAFTNTATLFFPRDDLSGIPFDMLFLSNVYIFFYALAARMGVLRLCRSHIYPTNLALLPWTEKFTEVAGRIEALRAPLFEACRRRIQAEEELEDSLSKLPIRTLKSHLRDDASAHLVWGDAFDFPDHEVEVSSLRLQERAPGEYLVFLSDGLFDSVELNRKDLAEGLAMALIQREGDSFGKSNILNLPIPVAESEKEIWAKTISDFDAGRLKEEMEARLSELDNIVGGALGLSAQEIALIRKECAEDPFLRIIRPRYPGTVTRKLGFRTGLDSSERYS